MPTPPWMDSRQPVLVRKPASLVPKCQKMEFHLFFSLIKKINYLNIHRGNKFLEIKMGSTYNLLITYNFFLLDETDRTRTGRFHVLWNGNRDS